ncbi:MAG: putative toxin-antitoxin system toxin component, PIN family [Chloroflexi bacterium]|nr:putative toxin-antitoxin system toxin component, PIN family [Chloroflexota bacterium]
MITAVLDTNVLAPALRGVGNPANMLGELLRQWRDGRFQLIVSEHILSELRRTLDTAYFSRSLSAQEREEAVALLATEAVLTPLAVSVRGVATHPEDDLILAAAVTVQADYLVTGDRKLLELGTYQDVRIVTPRDFLQLLQEDQPRGSAAFLALPGFAYYLSHLVSL